MLEETIDKDDEGNIIPAGLLPDEMKNSLYKTARMVDDLLEFQLDQNIISQGVVNDEKANSLISSYLSLIDEDCDYDGFDENDKAVEIRETLYETEEKLQKILKDNYWQDNYIENKFKELDVTYSYHNELLKYLF